MGEPGATRNRLVGDIGGTYTRLALFDSRSRELGAVRSYENDDFDGIEPIIARWLADLGSPRPTSCCLAVAAPPAGDRVTMINRNWSFSCRALARRFGFSALRCINDFEGNAYALPHLGAGEREVLRPGAAGDCRRYAVMGPGTGLGGAMLDDSRQGARAVASEPGHMGLAPANELELELFRVLIAEHGEVYAELLLSGPGLARLYTALAQVRGEAVRPLSSRQISAAALEGSSPLCRETLTLFCDLLGSACGDYVLATGCYGALYLAGGIVPGVLPLLRASDFAGRFSTKGAMAAHLGRVPLYVITSGVTGLLGAANAPLDDAAP